jgi:RloB-like protein
VRPPDSYKRRGPQREPYDYVLIVCEGEKTEPGYFRGLRQAYRLSSANIEITHPNATDPVNIVRFTEARLVAGGFDRAYCVFDRDNHTNHDEALQMVTQSENGKQKRLFAITSVPCFELWVLLHFRYTSSAFNKVG